MFNNARIALFRTVVVLPIVFAANLIAQDSTIPRCDPKPVVWLADFQPKDGALTEDQRSARDLIRYANRFKADGDYEMAEETYQRVITFDSSFPFAHYQLACNYELWGKHSLAVKSFTRAIEQGFDAFPTALDDDELGGIRERPEFSGELAKLREAYIASLPTKVGQPIAVPAVGVKPAGGWPVLFMLHGYGDSNVSYLDNARPWSDQGFVVVTLPGSVPGRSGSFIWALDSIDPTYADIQAVLKSPLLAEVNQEAVYLLGFSQGALHSMLVAAKHPDKFAGVVALSPGGSLADQLYEPKIARTDSPPCLFFIHGEQEPHAPIVTRWSRACGRAGWRFKSAVHPGRHHFPENWDEMQKDVAAFLRSK